MNDESISPSVVRRSDPLRVDIEWTDGTKSDFTAAALRRACPCARCVNELTGVRSHDPATVAEDLTQSDLRLVGNYAVTMTFSDGHHTGIFTFGLLRRLKSGGA